MNRTAFSGNGVSGQPETAPTPQQEARAVRVRAAATKQAGVPWGLDELTEAVVSCSPLALYVVDGEGTVQLWNPAAEELFGWTADEALGRYLPFVGPESEAEFDRLRSSVMAGGAFTGVEATRRHRSGRELQLSISTVPLHDASGSVRAVLGVALDITARKQAEAELMRQARFDNLTGLHSRGYFLAHIEQRLAGAHGGDALVFLDLDGFKNVNDTYGHCVGDKVLVEFANRLLETVRGSDVVARMGGDEFAVLLHDVGQRGAEVASRLVSQLRAPVTLGPLHLLVRPSAGVALSDGCDSPDEVLRCADIAMYEAKRGAAQDGVLVFDAAMKDLVTARARLEADVHRAVERRELVVHYQPTVDARTGRPCGFEALVRWEHPALGRLSPDQFIPLAEETGAIIGLGRWVLAQACATLQAWRHELAEPDLTMSVNLSPVQLRDPDLVGDVLASLAGNNLDPLALQLEVTETALAEPGAEEVLGALHAAGVPLAIDDFGTGYSSLTSLRRFPFGTLKIDRSFVSGVDHNDDDRAIVRATIGLSKALGLTTVAEGIERHVERDLLVEFGCDRLQGYLFGRPAPAHEIRELVGRSLSRR
jgi:diguanylate cyclase (GGDEF)-like protein/PAS domain S-box-containing protein